MRRSDSFIGCSSDRETTHGGYGSPTARAGMLSCWAVILFMSAISAAPVAWPMASLASLGCEHGRLVPSVFCYCLEPSFGCALPLSRLDKPYCHRVRKPLSRKRESVRVKSVADTVVDQEPSVRAPGKVFQKRTPVFSASCHVFT
jgi:hypothetical protein